MQNECFASFRFLGERGLYVEQEKTGQVSIVKQNGSSHIKSHSSVRTLIANRIKECDRLNFQIDPIKSRKTPPYMACHNLKERRLKFHA